MTTATINLYTFQELTQNAKQRAIEEHRYILLSLLRPDDFISGDPDYDTPEELQKAYNAEYDYILFNDDPIIESLEINEYLYFCDGKIANTTKTATETTLDFYGQKIRIA